MRSQTVEMRLPPGMLPDVKYCWLTAGGEGHLYKVSSIREDGTTEWVRASMLASLRFAGAWGLWSRVLHAWDVLLRRKS